MKFTQDDYFEPSKSNYNAFSSFILLKPDSLFSFSLDLTLPTISNCNPGDDIICVSSSLSTLLYDYFNSTFSKGVILNFSQIISCKFQSEIILFDLRILSYSQGALVSNLKSDFFAVLFPPITVGRLNNLLGFGIEIRNIVKILKESNKISHNKLNNVGELNLSFTNTLENIKDSVFIIYYGSTK